MCKIKSILYKYANNLFLVIIPLSLLFLAWESILFLACYLGIMIYYFIKKRGIIFYTIVILSIFIICVLFINEQVYDCNRYQNEDIDIEGMIIDKKVYDSDYGESYRYIIKTRIIKNKTFIFKKKIYVFLKSDYVIGDNILINGTVKEMDGEVIENGFDYENYLNKAKIYLVINGENSIYINNTFSIYKIKQIVNNYFDRHFNGDTLNIMKGLILGDSSSFSDEFDQALRDNGILHLFAVSGLHISLFITMLGGLLKLIKIKEEMIEKIIIVFLALYIILTSFSVSIIRASLMYFVGVINKRKLDKLLSSLDVISITFIILVLINPYYAYNTGFILSFMVSFTIVLVSSLLRKKNNYYQILVISILSNIFTLPIIININYEYNVLTPIVNVLYITLVSSFILPFGFITLVLPILSYSYDYVIEIFINLIKFTSNININLRLGHFSNLSILIFYSSLIILILFIRYKKIRRICITILSILIIYLCYLMPYTYYPEIDFLYLNDGDCTLIRYQNEVILIDTGDGKNDEVRDYLLSKGIKKIDYLIITHTHDDHYGGYDGIIDKIRIDNVITSEIYKYNYDNQIRVKPFDETKLKGMVITYLAPENEYDEENANSLACLIRIKSKSFLFLGDSTIEEEKEIKKSLIKLNVRDIDLIKIAHHGSNTGNSEELLNYLNIDYAVIMVGKTRKLSHPSKDVINRLDNFDIKSYCTIDCYSINVRIKNDSLVFNTLKK